MSKENIFESTFGDKEPGSLSYLEVERMMLNSAILEPLYDAIPKSEKDEILYFYDHDWSRRNVELKSEILNMFDKNKDRIYDASSRYRLNIRRIRNVFSELAGKVMIRDNTCIYRVYHKLCYLIGTFYEGFRNFLTLFINF